MSKNKIKDLRLTKPGLTQPKLALACGWPEKGSRISNYENARDDVYLSVARDIVNGLNKSGVSCSLDDVFPPQDKAA